MVQVQMQLMDWKRICGPSTVLGNIFRFLLVRLYSHGIFLLGLHVEATTVSLILYEYK